MFEGKVLDVVIKIYFVLCSKMFEIIQPATDTAEVSPVFFLQITSRTVVRLFEVLHLFALHYVLDVGVVYVAQFRGGYDTILDIAVWFQFKTVPGQRAYAFVF